MIIVYALFTYILLEGLCQLIVPEQTRAISIKYFFSPKNKKQDTSLLLAGILLIASNYLDIFIRDSLTSGISEFIMITIGLPLIVYSSIRLLISNEALAKYAEYVGNLRNGQVRTIGFIQSFLAAVVIIVLYLI